MHIDDLLNVIGNSKRSEIVDILTKVIENNSYAQMVARTCYVRNNPKMTRRKVLNSLSSEGYVYKVTNFKEYTITINY